MIGSICKEIISRSDFLNEEVQTIYFGGGTPSLLKSEELKEILFSIGESFNVSSAAEITLEANPEDLTPLKTDQIRDLGINRLSIGVQTFSNEKLKWMNRNHSSLQVSQAFENCRKSGFDNISLDLIYAVPVAGFNLWEADLEKVINLDAEHISLYGLTIEENTVFGKRKTRGEFTEVNEEDAATQYIDSVERLSKAGYNQYEVSNFSKHGFQSRHNSSYWAGIPYIGVGPGAHSYDGTSRQFNIRNNTKYIQGLKNGKRNFEIEKLSPVQRMNESILTRLRTIQGLNMKAFQDLYKVDFFAQNKKTLEGMINQGLINEDNHCISLTTSGFLVADEIALNLFFDE